MSSLEITSKSALHQAKPGKI